MKERPNVDDLIAYLIILLLMRAQKLSKKGRMTIVH